jgi:acetyl esterase
MDEIVEDAFGAVLWIKENIVKYGGDPSRIAVTGDSAGGHLASMVITMGEKLSNTGFDSAPLGFLPSYLPEGKSAEEIVQSDGLEVQAAVISYGAFDIFHAVKDGNLEKPANFFWMMAGNTARPIFGSVDNKDSITVESHPDHYKMVSPIYNLEHADDKVYPPQFFHVGSNDITTSPESIKAYVDLLKTKGQSVEYWVHEGRPHAYLDSGTNPYLGITFEKDAPPAIDKIIMFLDSVFYP